MQPNSPLLPSAFNRIFLPWLKIIKKNESGSVISMPKRDQLYRVRQFINDRNNIIKEYPYLDNREIIPLDLDSLLIEDPVDLHNYLKINIKQAETVLIIINADSLLQDKTSIFSYLDNLAISRNLTVIYLFQCNITAAEYASRLASFSSLFQNIVINRLYTPEESRYFIDYTARHLQIKLPTNIRHEILKQCSGHFWLIKQAVRYYGDTGDDKHLFDHDALLLRLKTLYGEFSPAEKKVIGKIIDGSKELSAEEKPVLRYLQNSGWLSDGDLPRFSVPILENHIKSRLDKENCLSLGPDKHILKSGYLIDNFFTAREKRLLRNFLENPGKELLRESVAEIIWGKNYEEKYTDWALDQAIRRLRNKFRKNGISNKIKTHKNKGYIFN